LLGGGKHPIGIGVNEAFEVLVANAPMLLGVALIFLLVYRAGERVKRVADIVERSLTAQAATYAPAYAMGFLYASAASLQALTEVASQMQWPYLVAASKVLQPGIVAIIAYVNKSPGQAAEEKKP
jgi:hypothetical protein